MEATERSHSAAALPIRSQASQASLYAFNAAESAAHNRPSITGLHGTVSPWDVWLYSGQDATEWPACIIGFAPSAVAALLNDLAALVSRRAAKQRDQRWSTISKDAAAQAVAAADAEAAAETDQTDDAEANVGDVEWRKVCWWDMQRVPA